MAIRRVLILKASRAPDAHTFLLNHPVLDIRGGGDRTFENIKLAFLADPDDGSVVRYFAADWAMIEAWFGLFRAFGAQEGWIVQPNNPNIDLVHYPSPAFTFEEALADTNLKPFELKRVGEPVDDP